MYDIIKLPINCPVCNASIDNCYTFQFDQLEETYYPEDRIPTEVSFVYIRGTAKCPNDHCKKNYFDVYIPHQNNIISDKYYYKAEKENNA